MSLLSVIDDKYLYIEIFKYCDFEDYIKLNLSYDDLEELLDLCTNKLNGDTGDKLIETISYFLNNVIDQLDPRVNDNSNINSNVNYYTDFLYNLSNIIHYPLLASLMLKDGFFNHIGNVLTYYDINKLLPKSLSSVDFNNSIHSYTDLYGLMIVNKLKNIIPDQIKDTDYPVILDNLSEYYYLSNDSYLQDKYIQIISDYIN